MAACCGEAVLDLTAILGSWGSARWASSKALSCSVLLGVVMGALPAPSSSSMETLQSIPCQGLRNAGKHGMYFGSKHCALHAHVCVVQISESGVATPGMQVCQVFVR